MNNESQQTNTIKDNIGKEIITCIYGSCMVQLRLKGHKIEIELKNNLPNYI